MKEGFEPKSDEIIIAKPEVFAAKLEKIQEGGFENLHIVADFDRTLTRSIRADGGVNTSLSTLWLFMPDEYAQRARNLFEKYRPIETDLEMSRDEKQKHMQDWIRNWQKNCVELGFSRETLQKIVKSELLMPRPGFKELFNIARQHSIPVLIFSAGLGDLIQEYLTYHDSYSRNVHVISNFAKFDEGGKCIGWNDDIVSSMNKDESHALYKSWKGEIADRKNIVLLGDHEADIHMADGAKHDTVLSVGFLNNEKTHLGRHAKTFDVVVVQDEGLDVPIKVLRSIAS
jgi:HAD superfamily hydrolase (TIGR01544 family)